MSNLNGNLIKRKRFGSSINFKNLANGIANVDYFEDIAVLQEFCISNRIKNRRCRQECAFCSMSEHLISENLDCLWRVPILIEISVLWIFHNKLISRLLCSCCSSIHFFFLLWSWRDLKKRSAFNKYVYCCSYFFAWLFVCFVCGVLYLLKNWKIFFTNES